MSTAERSDPPSGLLRRSAPAIYTVLAMLLLYWADLQQDRVREIAASTFAQPKLMWIGWSVTLIASGVAFGMAVAAARGRARRVDIPTLLWALLPLAPVLYLHMFLAGWISSISTFTQFVLSPGTQAACCVGVGVFLSGLISPEARQPSPSPGGV